MLFGRLQPVYPYSTYVLQIDVTTFRNSIRSTINVFLLDYSSLFTDRDQGSDGHRMPFRPFSADRDNRRAGTNEATPSDSASRMTRHQQRAVLYVTSPLPDGRFIVNKNHQEVFTTVQSPVPPGQCSVDSERVYQSVSFLQDESDATDLQHQPLRAPSPRSKHRFLIE